MAILREGARAARAAVPRHTQWMPSTVVPRRWASSESTASAPSLSDLETASSLTTPVPDAATAKAFDTAKRVADRPQQLPGKRFQYHPPKYDRGPLHPVQSPPSSDPTARDFTPGPFNLPRMKQTFDTTISSDLITLGYFHKPPGTPASPPRERLREWDESSPYHKNRPLRGPRGSSSLDLLEKDISFRHIPEIRSVSINAYVPTASKSTFLMPITRAAIQAITGVTPTTIKIRTGVAQWKLREGERAGVKATIHGNAAYEFVDKLANLVLPKIKEWPGLKGTTGDSNGNLSLGLRPEDMAWFPEIAANFDMYPPKHIPGCRIYIHTTATSDRHARLLFQSLGFPFYGKIRDF